MIGEQALFDVPRATVDERTASLLALIAGDPLHQRDREVIVAAIVAEAEEHEGRVNPNRVRERLRLPGSREFAVYPRVIGAVYLSLKAHGYLEQDRDRWVTSTDAPGGNAGKPTPVYRLRHVPDQRPKAARS